MDTPIFDSQSPDVLHLNLDDAWPADLGLPTRDLRNWGPRLRFTAPSREIAAFDRELGETLPPFLIYGSGDFHHLSALWLRRQNRLTTLVSFDNHPDWDIRPPRWCCGGWINRALELPQIAKASVWGCGSFECWWPGRIFGNNRAERRGRLEVHPWADDRDGKDRERRGAIFRADWREKFQLFVRHLAGAKVYVTIDLDCLRAAEAATNWESGRFAIEDVVWALELLGHGNRIVAGDICGAWSPASYARRKQQFASTMDHPKLPPRDPVEIRRTNTEALHRLLPVLAQGDQNDPEADNDRADR
jgi:arginase family enzyme